MSILNSGLDSFYRKMVKNTFGSFGLIVATTFINLLIVVMLARLLGTTGYGQYTLAMTVIGFIAIPTTLGLPNLMVRFTAAYEVKKQWQLLKGIITFSHFTVLVLSLVFTALAFLLVDQYSLIFMTDNTEVFLVSILMLPLLAIIAIQGSIMRGLHHVLKGQISGTFFKSILYFLCVAYLFFSQSIASPEFVMMLQLLCILLALFLSMWMFTTTLPVELKHTELEYDIRLWIKSAVPLFFMGGMQLVNQQADLLMIGYFMEESAVGIYQVSLKVSELVILLLMAANMALGPIISSLFHQGKIVELQNVMTKTARYVSLLTLPVVLIIIFFGESLISFVFGAVYFSSYEPLIILLVAQFINVLVGSVGLLLMMTGYEKEATIGLIMAAGVNIVLNLLLVPSLGMIGAAVATAVSMVVWNLILSSFSLRKTSINCSVFRF